MTQLLCYLACEGDLETHHLRASVKPFTQLDASLINLLRGTI